MRIQLKALTNEQLLLASARAMGHKTSCLQPGVVYIETEAGHHRWNPLEDDAQAFVLGVSHYISPVIGLDAIRVPGHPHVVVPYSGNGRLAAMRRALVLALVDGLPGDRLLNV